MHPHEEGGDNRAHSDLSFEVTSSGLNLFPDAPLIWVNEHDERGNSLKQEFYNLMHSFGLRTRVEGLYTQDYSTIPLQQGRVRIFSVMVKAMKKINEGYGRPKRTWFGGSKDDINIISKYGFPNKGPAIILSPFESPLASLRVCVADEIGLYHFFLCQVLLGRSEVVPPAILQRSPSAMEFHSGVDNLSSPRVYMVWSTSMNTNILPQWVISFVPPVKVNVAAEVVNVSTAPQSKSKRTVFFLLHELTTELHVTTIKTLLKLWSDLQERKLTELEYRKQLKELVGLELLNKTLQKIGAGNAGNFAPPNKGRKDLPHTDAWSFTSKYRGCGVLPPPQNAVSFRPPVPVIEEEVSSTPETRESSIIITFSKLLQDLILTLPMNTIRRMLMLLSQHEEGEISDLELKKNFEDMVGLDLVKKACLPLQ